MNPRDLPEVIPELIVEMHEVRSESQGLNGRVDRLAQTMAQVVEEQCDTLENMRGMREDMQAMPDRIGMAVIKSLEPSLNCLLDHDTWLKNHENRLGCFENLQA